MNPLTKGRNWMQIRQDDDLRLTVPTSAAPAFDGRDTRRGEIPRGIAKSVSGGEQSCNVHGFRKLAETSRERLNEERSTRKLFPVFRAFADASASPLVREGIATPWRLEIVSPYMPRSSAFNCSEAIMSLGELALGIAIAYAIFALGEDILL